MNRYVSQKCRRATFINVTLILDSGVPSQFSMCIAMSTFVDIKMRTEPLSPTKLMIACGTHLLDGAVLTLPPFADPVTPSWLPPSVERRVYELFFQQSIPIS